MTGDEDIGSPISSLSKPDFPHETTGDQFYAEDQFESYRTLGQHIATVTFRGAEDRANVVAMAHKLADIWVADMASGSDFVNRTQALVELWDRMRGKPWSGPPVPRASWTRT